MPLTMAHRRHGGLVGSELSGRGCPESWGPEYVHEAIFLGGQRRGPIRLANGCWAEPPLPSERFIEGRRPRAENAEVGLVQNLGLCRAHDCRREALTSTICPGGDVLDERGLELEATSSHPTEDEACVGHGIAILLDEEVWAGAELSPHLIPPAPCRVGVCRFQPALQVAQLLLAECFAFESLHGWHVVMNISESYPGLFPDRVRAHRAPSILAREYPFAGASRHAVASRAMVTFRLTDPFHVRNAEGAAIPGHYELDVEVDDGRTLRRFATDKGRAEILRRLDEGLHDITQDEFDDLTVAPDMDALLERMGSEAGDGA